MSELKAPLGSAMTLRSGTIPNADLHNSASGSAQDHSIDTWAANLL